MTSDDSCNIEDHSRNSMDVSRTCANHTLRESSVKLLKSLHWLKVSERIEYKIISHKTLNTTQSPYLYDLIVYPFSHVMVVSLHTLFSLCHSGQTVFITQTYSSLLPTCFTSWTQLPIHHSEFFIQRPSFEHAGLICCTLRSPSITFSLFHSEFKNYQKTYPPHNLFLSVGLISWL